MHFMRTLATVCAGLGTGLGYVAAVALGGQPLGALFASSVFILLGLVILHAEWTTKP